MRILRCPQCKRRIYPITLYSNPPQYQCECSGCKISLRRSKRVNAFAEITQEEVDEFMEAW